MIDFILGIIGTIINTITSAAFLPYENFSPIFIILVIAAILIVGALKRIGWAVKRLIGIRKDKSQ